MGTSVRADDPSRPPPFRASWTQESPIRDVAMAALPTDPDSPAANLPTLDPELPTGGANRQNPPGQGGFPGLTNPASSEPEEPLSLFSRELNAPKAQTDSGVPLVPFEQALLPRNPLQRTAMNQAFSTGEALTDGIGGNPGTLATPFLRNPSQRYLGFHLGFIHYEPVAGLLVNSIRENSATGSNREGTLITLQGGLYAIVGEPTSQLYGVMNYQAGVILLDKDNQSRFDQELSLTLNFSPRDFEKMQFSLGVSFDGLSGLDRDTGADTERNLLTVALASTFAFSPKTSLDWNFTIPIREFNGGISSSGITSTTLLNYHFSEKTLVGIGFSLGTLKVDQGDNQTFEQAIVNLEYNPSPKFSLYGTFGCEFRQAGGKLFTGPIFGVGATWTPRLGTSVKLAAERRTFNSAEAMNSNYTSTSITLSLDQRLGSRVTLSLSLGYENAQYESVGAGGDGSRRDDLIEGQIGFTLFINSRWSCSLSLSASDNYSNQRPLQEYQLAFQTSYAF